jgi:hypothetical protein
MAMSELATRLQIKPGNSVSLVDPPAGFALELPAGAARVEDRGEIDVVLAFVTAQKDLPTVAGQALRRGRPGGILWICYPKKTGALTSDVNRDIPWTPLADAGYRPVTQVAIDDTWSALRFRPLSEVGQ